MSLKLRQLVGVLLWGCALYGVLCLGMVPGDFGHALCGAWG
jgi:hypothetical protein